ncbi:FAD-binding oxidoreductase [Mesonia sp. K7]|uniref:NAD(P)/FAD-dependent oxidoreductase n=1 Tax=Mesonia sp. K7 TaxID=2218606 RepID=UPI000DAA2833|nr:FAD-dependent oxidoreductase [Mesonia sp. K7]PZD77389.1 FAD-dependent oxidoreductase [Mesonia sp. K7]
MNKSLSYWELKTYFTQVDFTIIGSGITGLNCALRLRENFPKAKILVLEKGVLPEGASTKNAGFACFGSVSELLDDLKTQSEGEVAHLVAKRYQGLQQLRNNLGDKNIGYKNYGGYEVFTENHTALYEECFSRVEEINRLLQPIFSEKVFRESENKFSFGKVLPKFIYNAFEAQIDTGKMMHCLLRKAVQNDILILNHCHVKALEDTQNGVEVILDSFSFQTQKVCIATNGFGQQLGIEKVNPARAQVLITKPIENLQFKGTFHLEQGYYYFRNIDNRILLGGGRNLNVQGETTTEFSTTEQIQNQLDKLLSEVILPHQKAEIEHRWSGIMGVGKTKKPILKQVSNNVYCGVRLGGMGIAIGTFVGQQLADLTNRNG